MFKKLRQIASAASVAPAAAPVARKAVRIRKDGAPTGDDAPM